MCRHPADTDLNDKRLLLEGYLQSHEKIQAENKATAERLREKCQQILADSQSRSLAPGTREIRERLPHLRDTLFGCSSWLTSLFVFLSLS